MSIKYSDNQGDVLATTLWHELSHAIEDIHGDYGLISTLKGVDYYERNVEYMENVVRALKRLAMMERKQAGLTSENATKYWDMFMKDMTDASEKPKYKADPQVLKAQ